jgi:poly(3-hydroxybutyrate) depolymerase
LSFALLVLVLISCEKGDLPSVQPQRYLEEIYSEIQVDSVEYSVPYGLYMDIYQPKGDVNTSRPVVVIAHGGAFFNGNKQTPGMVRLATSLTKRGYVVGSINYHKATDFNDVLDSVKAAGLVMNAIGDGRAAVRYFRKTFDEGNPYRIDPNKIFAGGNSAGGIIALHLGFLDSLDALPPHLDSIQDFFGGWEGNSGNPGYSSSVKAVFNMAGALKSKTYIDQDDTPLINFHGVDDDVVPYECGNVYSGLVGNFDVVKMCGSLAIHNRCLERGVETTLYSYPGKHVPWMNSDTGEPLPLFDEIEEKIITFLYEHL